jgi:hypothetical protein
LAWHLGPSPTWPLLVVVIDEAHSFFHERKGTSPEVKAHNAVVAELSRLVEELIRKGRNVAIQVMLLTQRATGDAIPTRIRDNCQVAISFATRTLDGAVAALGEEIRQHPDLSPVLLNDPAYVGVAVTSLPGRPGFCRVRTPQVDHHHVAAVIRATDGLRADPAALLAEQAPGAAGRPRHAGTRRCGVTEPVRVGELLPGVLGELVERAGHGYERWAELVAQAGYCHHPIRLAGRVEQADRTTGEVRAVYDTGREPDGVLLKACGTRRESRCPSCAATYRADAYQLLAAGLKGGKGVPETVAGHPRLFVTFTAPSFGKVHARKAQGRLVLPCHPYRQGVRCPHGNRAGCWHRHDEDDPRLGEPLCAACYDSEAQVLWNALAPELWRRTTIAVQRALGRLVGLHEGELRRLVRISFAKVAEFQRRGAIHFHAVIRLDAATECRCPGCLAPPPEGFTATLLEDALRQAAPTVRVPCPLVVGGPARYARWGEQLDVRNISRADGEAGELSAEQVAGYIAKYATKATESFGSGLDHRISADDLAQLDQLPAHIGELVRACWELGGRPELERLRLRAWAHMLGFGGHWSTKSRRYSTTFTVLRRARVAFAKRRRAKDGIPLDAWGRPEDDQAVIVVATWTYIGAGYETEGERWLALSAAARAREHRRIAREELTTTTASAA